MKIWMLLCGLALLLAGCAPIAATRPGIAPSATAALVPQVSTSLPGGETPVPTEMPEKLADVILTLDNPQAVLRVGETAALRLDDGYLWTITIDDERVLAQLPDEEDGWRLFKGVGNGNVTLRVQGDPLCLTAKPPCMAPSRLVEFQILVD